jgi:hypothetical protein
MTKSSRTSIRKSTANNKPFPVLINAEDHRYCLQGDFGIYYYSLNQIDNIRTFSIQGLIPAAIATS